MSHIPKPLGVLREKNSMQGASAAADELKPGPKSREDRLSSGGATPSAPGTAVDRAHAVVVAEPSQVSGTCGGAAPLASAPARSIPTASSTAPSSPPQPHPVSLHSNTSGTAASGTGPLTGRSVSSATSSPSTASTSGSIPNPTSPAAPQSQSQTQVPAAGRPSFKSHIPTAPKAYQQSQLSLVSPDRSSTRSGTRAQQRHDQLFAQKAIAEEYNTVVPAVRGEAAEEEALEQLALRLAEQQRARWLVLTIEAVMEQVTESIAAALAEEAALVPSGAAEGAGAEAAQCLGGDALAGQAARHVPLEPIFPAAPGAGRGHGLRNPEGSSNAWPLPNPAPSGKGGGATAGGGGGGAGGLSTRASRIGSGAAMQSGGRKAGAEKLAGGAGPESEGGSEETAEELTDDAIAAGGAEALVQDAKAAAGTAAAAPGRTFPLAAVAVKGGATGEGRKGAVVPKPPRLRLLVGCCSAPRARYEP